MSVDDIVRTGEKSQSAQHEALMDLYRQVVQASTRDSIQSISSAIHDRLQSLVKERDQVVQDKATLNGNT